jgi:hypothetical protein
MLKYFFSFIAILWFAPDLIAKPSDSEGYQPPHAINQLLIESQKNYPMTFSQNKFEGAHPYPAISYRHYINGDWIMGVGATFKLFRQKIVEDNEDINFSIWSFHHEAAKIIRIYHPTYLMLGTKIIYMIPAKKHSLPLQKQDQYETEIGFALTATMVQILNDSFSATFRIDRYRGTKTQLFQGLEIAFGISYAFK